MRLVYLLPTIFIFFSTLSYAEDKDKPQSPEENQAEEESSEDLELEELLSQPMNNLLLHQLILTIDPNPSGQLGLWEFQHEDTLLICVTDESADRMRIMTTIAELEEVSEEQMRQCMVANFDRALDARYCVNHGSLWGAFIHPLSTLSPVDFFSAVQQVVGVKANFGTSYSSGAMIFRGGEDQQELEAKERIPAS